VLDEADPIEDAYILNVSSPGIERVLRTDAHLEAAVGVRVEVRLFAAIDGQKALRGTLTAVSAESITLDERDIPRSAISKVRTVFFE
jgi:ribosome maturation factor RimP